MKSVVWGLRPVPVFLHQCLGHDLDSAEDLVLCQLDSGDPVGDIFATHVVDLMRPFWQRADPLADVGRQ